MSYGYFKIIWILMLQNMLKSTEFSWEKEVNFMIFISKCTN